MSELYGSIITRVFDPLQPITVFLTNCNLALLKTDSYINYLLTPSVSVLRVKWILFLWLRRKVLPTFILKNIFEHISSFQMELSRDLVWIIWNFHADVVLQKHYYLIFVSPKYQQKLWWSKQIQCIFIGRNKTVCRFA